MTAPRTPTGRGLLVVIPTFDEAENIAASVAAVLQHVPEADVLVVDDDSPDGTGEIAETLRSADPRVHVLHRTVRTGLAGAYLHAFDWALARDYAVIAEFDADGSHPASALPSMLRALESSPDVRLVIGSRWIPGGSVANWPFSREVLSRGGNAYARLMLGLPARDVTAGFRLYPASALRGLALDEVASRGYGFQVDMTERIHRSGGRIVEVPIRFQEREHGVSKMSRAIVAEAMALVTVSGARRVTRRMRNLLPKSVHRPG